MKKIRILAILIIGCLFLNAFIGAKPSTATAEIVSDINAVKSARFEHMLNINTVYGDDFYDNQKLVNAAMIMLKSYADDNGFVKSEIVSAYIKDLYDIDIDINEKINEGFPQRDGYVLLIPRGHSEYEHTVTSVQTYEDYILVVSSVRVKTHDGGEYTVTAHTRFAENQNSSFGYTIISSELIELGNAIKI